MGKPANPFLMPLGSSQPPADGPGRVVKGGKGALPAAGSGMSSPDWRGVAPERAMRGFSLQAFGGSGKAQLPSGEDSKLAELKLALHKSEEARRHATESAKEEMVEMAKAALAEGLEKGRVEGEANAWRQYEQKLAVLQRNTEAAIRQMSSEKAEAFLAYEKLCLDLFADCLRKVMGSLPQWHDDIVIPMLRESIAALGHATAMTIRVHPDDFVLAKEKRTIWETLESAVADIRFEPDARIPKGGCLVESGATSAAADPASFAERAEEIVQRIHQSRIDALRRDSAGPSDG